MEYKKYIETDRDLAPRWYDDACGTAFALELIGQRWSLLIIRELLFGPLRFSDLRSSLSGITAKALTERLEGLRKTGIVRRFKLPPPASVQVYELTEWGAKSERAIQELGRWAVASPDHDPTLPLSAASLMSSFRTMLVPERLAGLRGMIGFRFGDEAFLARLEDNELVIRRSQPDGADATFTSTTHGLAAVVYGGLPMVDAEQESIVRVEGDRALAERFCGLFAMPEKYASLG